MQQRENPTSFRSGSVKNESLFNYDVMDMINKGTVIIAELGINHDGSLERAKKLVNIAMDAGADIIKTQMWDGEELFRDKKSKDYLEAKNFCLSKDEMKELKSYCDEKGAKFLCTPDDEGSLNFLVDELNVCAIKIGSGELNNLPFLEKVAKKGLPIILSTGMGTMEEVRTAVNIIKQHGDSKKLILLHCTSSYPTPLKEVNLKAIRTLREAFGLPIGYSDHTEGLMAAYSAVLLGSCVIEKHYTDNNNSMVGPDHRASLDPGALKELVDTVGRAEAILGCGDKAPTDSEMINRIRVRKSIVASRDIVEGEVIALDDLAFKRPGDGLPPSKVDYLIGKKAVVNIMKDDKIVMMVKE